MKEGNLLNSPMFDLHVTLAFRSWVRFVLYPRTQCTYIRSYYLPLRAHRSTGRGFHSSFFSWTTFPERRHHKDTPKLTVTWQVLTHHTTSHRFKLLTAFNYVTTCFKRTNRIMLVLLHCRSLQLVQH